MIVTRVSSCTSRYVSILDSLAIGNPAFVEMKNITPMIIITTELQTIPSDDMHNVIKNLYIGGEVEGFKILILRIVLLRTLNVGMIKQYLC